MRRGWSRKRRGVLPAARAALVALGTLAGALVFLAVASPEGAPEPSAGGGTPAPAKADTTRRASRGASPPRPSAATEAPVPGPGHFSLLATSDTRGAVAPCG